MLNAPNGAKPEISVSPYSTGAQPLILADSVDPMSPMAHWTAYPSMQGAYKGTYDTVQPYSFYRSETRFKDSLFLKFVVGDLWVNDSGSGLYRQVRLHTGLDTLGYSSSAEARDSLFRSEWFTVPTGSQVSYFRGMFAPINLMDTAQNSLKNPMIDMNYIMELVHSSGMIDTLEILHFTPGSTLPTIPIPPSYIQPKAAHSAIHVGAVDTVQFRVYGNVAGFSEGDSAKSFEIEYAYDKYPYSSDTLVAYKGGSHWMSAEETSLAVQGPFPNPVGSSSRSVGLLLHVPKGLAARVDIFDVLGRSVSEQMIVSGLGAWTRLSFEAPLQPGTYNVRAIAGSAIKYTHFVVLR